MVLRARLLEAQQRIVAALGLTPVEARIEVQALMQAALRVDRAWLITHAEDALDETAIAWFESQLIRRLGGEPIAYIVGSREFHGIAFNVTPATLIPRPDTETLVEAALEKIPSDGPCSILDLGTGSGAIAIAIAVARPQSSITAVERSLAALEVARGNAERLGIANIAFVHSDWFAGVSGRRFDIIVSNPPYIAQDDPHLQQGDLRFEPLSALAAGADGLDCIRHIVALSGDHLAPCGWLLLEHGFDQADRVAELLHDSGFSNVNCVKDLAGNPRATLGQAG